MGVHDDPRHALHAVVALPHWNRVRCAAGLGNAPLYLATRHWFGWFALNVLDLPPHQIALQLGHHDGGRLVRELYGHPDAAIARERLRQAVRSTAPSRCCPSLDWRPRLARRHDAQGGERNAPAGAGASPKAGTPRAPTEAT